MRVRRENKARRLLSEGPSQKLAVVRKKKKRGNKITPRKKGRKTDNDNT